ncbi:MAG TPA: helix-turn-helix transcriptional regulator [Ktedonobacterales bacterium]
MADLQETIGTVIRQERHARGMTLKELASRSALSVVYLGELERGKKYPSGIVLERIAEALDLSVADLLVYVAETLRAVEAPVITHAMGFRAPGRGETTPRASIMNIVGLLVA